MKAMPSYLQDTPFYVDQTKGKVFADFGNSLPIHENGSFDTKILGDLYVALPLNRKPSFTCSDNLRWLGLIHNKVPNWYQNTAGVQAFPSLGSLLSHEIREVSQRPLVVAEVRFDTQVMFVWESGKFPLDFLSFSTTLPPPKIPP